MLWEYAPSLTNDLLPLLSGDYTACKSSLRAQSPPSNWQADTLHTLSHHEFPLSPRSPPAFHGVL